MPATGESADFSVHQGRVYTAGTALHAKRARNAGMPLPLTLTHDYTFTWRTIGCGSSWFSLTLEVPKGAG
jgi:hypothetical protein